MMSRSFVKIIALISGIYGWTISLTSIFKTGVGWDSVFDLNSAKMSLENSNTLNLATYYDLIPITSEFYGTLIYRISDWASIQTIGRSIFENTLLINNYYFIDLTTWFISLISILIICYSLYITFDSSTFSFLFFGMISTLPIWVGMSQVNSKDLPVAAGISILSAGFMLILNQNLSKKYFYLGVLFTSIGSGISLSVRPASITIVLSFIVLNSTILFFYNLGKIRFYLIMAKMVFTFFATSIFSTFMLYMSNPISSRNLYPWILDAVSVSLDYPSIQPVRVFGRDFLSNELPFWYVGAWVWGQLPILTFFSLILGLIILLKKFIFMKDLDLLYWISPFCVQAFFIPVLLLFSQPNLYNGIRHLLFIYPALTLISIVFLNRLLDDCDSKFIRRLSCNFAILVIVLNIFATHRWKPYSYAFVNPVAGFGNHRNWDLDYWGLSAREGIDRLTRLGYSKDIIVMPDNSSSIPFGGINANQKFSIETPFGLYVYIHWNHKIVEEFCKIDFIIMRDFQTLGMGGHCDYPFKS
jgi:hypothetical protein